MKIRERKFATLLTLVVLLSLTACANQESDKIRITMYRWDLLEASEDYASMRNDQTKKLTERSDIS